MTSSQRCSSRRFGRWALGDADDAIVERLTYLRNEVSYLFKKRLTDFDAYARAIAAYLEREEGDRGG
jgi:hypothetical protein